MALSTHTVLAYQLSALVVIVNAAASCDDINCVTCKRGQCEECRGGYYIYNRDCYPCRDNCTTCKDANFCTVCDDGFYTFEASHYTACEKCPPYCVKCNSTIFCFDCTPGHYGKDCGVSCNACKDGACSKTDCTHGCIDGHFQIYVHENYGHCSICTANCKACTSHSHCNTCNDGFYLVSYGVGNTCNPCKSSCKSCSSLSVCDSCPRGRWNSTCESNCPVGCKNNTCDITTGLCNEGCTEGYYMQSDGVCYPCLQSSIGCHCQYYPCTTETTNQQTSILTPVDRALPTTVFPVGQTEATPQAGVDDTVPVDRVLTTTVPFVSQTEAKPQAEDEDTVPVGIIAGAVGGAVFILLVTGAVFAFIFMKRRNELSSIDTASRIDPPYENTSNTNVGGMSTYAYLCHVSEEENPYSTMTRNEYENVNV